MKKARKESVLSRAFRIAAQGKGMIAASCAASTLGMLAGIVPYLSVFFIAKQLLMPAPGADTARVLTVWAVVAGIAVLCNMVFSFLGSYGAHRVAFRLLYGFRVRVMEHIGHLPIGFFATHTTGSVQKTMDENIEKIEGFVAHMLPDLIGSAVVLAALFVSLFTLNIWLALTVLVVIIIGFAFQFSMFGGEKGKELWANVAAASREMTGAFSEYVKGIAEVKLFGLSGTITRGLEANIAKYRTWELRQYKRSAPAYTAYKTVILSLLAFVLPAGILLIIANPAPATLLAVLMTLIITPSIYDPLMTCLSYGSQMGQLGAGLDAIDGILSEPVLPLPEEPIAPKEWDVSFEGVSFSYQAEDDPGRTLALSGVTFTAPAGRMTALVGPSGGGKSTVGQLLSRFWDLQGGSIRIGGIDIRQMPLALLMDTIATVFQDTYLFADTIRGNITMNRPYAKAQVEAAARAAQCHNFIMALPDGYETRIGTGASGLSGGEAQRLSIARAILKDSPIIVLDEALAYSDAENENLIQKAIASLVKGKTVIIIAHRLQSIRAADQILLLEKGAIRERGTHEALMAGPTGYRELWDLQHQADAWTLEVDANGKEATA